MTLSYLLSRLKAHLDHNANIQAQDDLMIDTLNQAYEEVTARHRWLSLYRTVQHTLYADVDGSSTATVGLPNGSNVVTGVGTSFHSAMEGQKMTVAGTDYAILGVASTTSLYLASTNTGAAVVGSSDWSIAFDFTGGPKDVRAIETLLDRTNNIHVHYVSRADEAHIILDEITGLTTHLVELEGLWKRTYEAVLTTTVGNGGANSLNASTRYGYCSTLERRGQESHPTQTVYGDTTAGNRTVTVGGLNKSEVGDRLRLYRRNFTTKSGWYLLRTWAPGDASPGSFIDDGSTALDQDTVLTFYGPQPRFKPYPKPGSDTTLEVGYIRKPNRLVANNQGVELPQGPAVDCLHHMAASTILLSKNPQLADFHARQGEKLLATAAGSPDAVIRAKREPIRRNFDSGWYAGMVTLNNTGTATKL